MLQALKPPPRGEFREKNCSGSVPRRCRTQAVRWLWLCGQLLLVRVAHTVIDAVRHGILVSFTGNAPVLRNAIIPTMGLTEAERSAARHISAYRSNDVSQESLCAAGPSDGEPFFIADSIPVCAFGGELGAESGGVPGEVGTQMHRLMLRPCAGWCSGVGPGINMMDRQRYRCSGSQQSPGNPRMCIWGRTRRGIRRCSR